MTIFTYPQLSVVIPGVAQETTLRQIRDSAASIDTRLISQATAANQGTQIAAVGATNSKLDTLNATDFASKAKQDAQSAILATLKTDTASIDSSTSSIDSKTSTVITNTASTVTNTASTATNTAAANLKLQALVDKTEASLVKEPHDYRAISYVGATTKIATVIYKLGGVAGTTVATLTLGYDGSDRLISVEKS